MRKEAAADYLETKIAFFKTSFFLKYVALKRAKLSAACLAKLELCAGDSTSCKNTAFEFLSSLLSLSLTHTHSPRGTDWKPPRLPSAWTPADYTHWHSFFFPQGSLLRTERTKRRFLSFRKRIRSPRTTRRYLRTAPGSLKIRELPRWQNWEQCVVFICSSKQITSEIVIRHTFVMWLVWTTGFSESIWVRGELFDSCLDSHLLDSHLDSRLFDSHGESHCFDSPLGSHCFIWFRFRFTFVWFTLRFTLFWFTFRFRLFYLIQI